MTDLIFTQQGENWVATTTVKKDYTLHLEREDNGGLYMKQKAEGTTEYGACQLPENFKASAGTVIDYDFSHGVYPKDIQIISKTKVLVGKIIETS